MHIQEGQLAMGDEGSKEAARARVQALIASRKGGAQAAAARGQAPTPRDGPGGSGDPLVRLAGGEPGGGTPPPQTPVPPAPTPEEIAAAERAVQVREAVLQAQDNAILGTVLINIFERFGPGMTTTERLIMIREIEVYNPAYARRVKAAMQAPQAPQAQEQVS